MKFAKLTFLFYFFVKSPNLPFCHIFKMKFDYDPEGILKKEEHFQLSVFQADFKYAVKNGILITWIFWFLIGWRKFQGKARPVRCKIFKLKLMSSEAQDSPTTRTTRGILILLIFVISEQASEHPIQLQTCFLFFPSECSSM